MNTFYLITLFALSVCCITFCCLFAHEIPSKFADYDKCREEYRRFFGPHALMNEKKRQYYQAIIFTITFILLATICLGTAINIYTSTTW